MRQGQRGWIVARLDRDGWRLLQAPFHGDQLVDLTVTDDGEVWVTDLTEGLFRFGDGTWQAATEAGASADPEIDRGGVEDDDWLVGAAGREGTVWLVRCRLVDDPWKPVYGCDTVLRQQEGSWASWSVPSELEDGASAVAVAPDGSAWFIPVDAQDSAGLLRFDGSTWSRFLPRRTVYALPGMPAFATDGAAWITSEPAYARSGRQRTIHLITPEAFSDG